MKSLFMAFLILTLSISCADKNANKSGSSSTNATNPFSSTVPGQATTTDGYIVTSTGQIEVSGTMFNVDQQSVQVIQNAINIARQQGIQPLYVNNLYKFRARITAFQNNSYGGTPILTVSYVQVY